MQKNVLPQNGRVCIDDKLPWIFFNSPVKTGVKHDKVVNQTLYSGLTVFFVTHFYIWPLHVITSASLLCKTHHIFY